jgi:hypothetical protein
METRFRLDKSITLFSQGPDPLAATLWDTPFPLLHKISTSSVTAYSKENTQERAPAPLTT